jgi:hypothetical protein|tara:strand:+ start:236 stop:481 length:246 start_codon:yes stop_codon:yes gene_type:complete
MLQELVVAVEEQNPLQDLQPQVETVVVDQEQLTIVLMVQLVQLILVVAVALHLEGQLHQVEDNPEQVVQVLLLQEFLVILL